MACHRTQLLISLSATALAAVACLDPAADRAKRDFEEVGRAQVSGIEVTIEPGVVIEGQAGSPPSFTLRASAPVVEVRLTADTAGAEVALRIENLTADAEVTGAGISQVEAPSPLVRRMRVRVPAVLRIAPPAASSPRAVRFGFASDFHLYTDNVAAMVAAVAGDPTIEMVLCGGDLFDNGAAADQWEIMERALAGLSVPFYCTVGNHELNGDDGVSFHRRLGRMTYAFDYHGVRVVFADSANATVAPRVFDFVDQAFAAGGATVRIFVTHVPPFDSSGFRNGGFSSRFEAGRLLAMLAGNQVDLTLYGHVHALEIFENAGIPAYIGGGGGGHDNVFDDVGHYFLVVSVDPIARRTEVSIHDL